MRQAILLPIEYLQPNDLNLLTFEGEISWALHWLWFPLGPVPQRWHHKDYLRVRIRNVELTIITTNVELDGSVVILFLTLDCELNYTK